MSGEPQPAAPAAEATEFRCALCGQRFTHDGRACGSCATAAGCDLVHCPHCGYQFPRSSRLLDRLRGWLRAGRRSG